MADEGTGGGAWRALTDAKSELESSLQQRFPGRRNRQRIHDILSDYVVARAPTGGGALLESINAYLSARRIDGLADRTIGNYRQALSAFARAVDKQAGEITTQDLRGYIAALMSRMRPNSVHTHICTLRAYFNWLALEERIGRNPMLRIQMPRPPRKGYRHGLTAEELERLREACTGYREKALLEFYVSTGCRLSEAVGLRAEQLDMTARSVSVTGKGGKERTVYFSVRAKLMIGEYLRTRKGGDALFVSGRRPYDALGSRAVENIIAALGRRAGIKRRVHPHLLRHTFATNALNAGMDITVIQKLLGHEDVGTTQIYAETSGETARHQYNKYIA